MLSNKEIKQKEETRNVVRNTESFQRPPILKREILEQEITCTLMKT